MWDSVIESWTCVICFHIFSCICRCVLRFPSTNIKIVFQAIGEGEFIAPPLVLPSPPRRPKLMPPLNIDIPKRENIHTSFISPCPSPTGTIRFVLYCVVVGLAIILYPTYKCSWDEGIHRIMHLHHSVVHNMIMFFSNFNPQVDRFIYNFISMCTFTSRELGDK